MTILDIKYMKSYTVTTSCYDGYVRLISTVDPTYVYDINESLFDQKMAKGEFVEGVA